MLETDVPRALAIEGESFSRGDVDFAVREGQLREELARSWAELRVARSAGEGDSVLGYVLFWHVTDEIHLLNVAVDPAARRCGIGRRLVLAVIEFAEARSADKILLEVRASNEAAIRLYEGLGFERFHVRARYYSDGEDGIEMMLRLEEP